MLTGKFVTGVKLVILLVTLSIGAACYAAPAPLPDLHGGIDGLQEAIKGTSCFDPAQPWYVCFTIDNSHAVGTAPVADAGPFSLKLEIMKGPKVDSGVLKTVSQDLPDGLKAKSYVSLCMHLQIGRASCRERV